MLPRWRICIREIEFSSTVTYENDLWKNGQKKYKNDLKVTLGIWAVMLIRAMSATIIKKEAYTKKEN